MVREPGEPPHSILIGPGLDEEAGSDGHREPHPTEGRRLVLRLVLAFFLIIAITILCVVLLPIVGIPPWVPLAAFGVISVAVLLHAGSEGQFSDTRDLEPPDRRGSGDGRPIGCCPGPRPPASFREPPRR
jgi:hypothetical protein